LQLCQDHPQFLSICVRYIPSPIIALDLNERTEGSTDSSAVSSLIAANSLKHFCANFFEDSSVPDCVWTRNCRKELLCVILQCEMSLPSMTSSISDDSIIRPVMRQNVAKFVSSAQKQYTSVHGVYLELFVSQGKWVCCDSKLLFEDLFAQLSALFQDHTPESPSCHRDQWYALVVQLLCLFVNIFAARSLFRQKQLICCFGACTDASSWKIILYY
jgi:hypothetical protein